MSNRINTARIKNIFISYLFKTGVLGHLILIVALLFPTLVLKEPLGYFLERTANQLNYYGGSKKQRYFGKLLLQYLPINDWQTPQLSQLSLLRDLKKWQGQGASKNITFTSQKYLGKIPVLSHIGNYYSAPQNTKYIYTTEELTKAIKTAHPGDTLQLMPGNYMIQQHMSISRSGLATAPITVRSTQLGLVKINLNTSEGFHIKAPFWVFENLEIQGFCSKENHSNCEHAFHVVGDGHSFVLRNNKIYNFNATLKVNGTIVNDKIVYPDFGLIEKNSFYNTTPRNTLNPVNLININSVNNWIVRSNLIADFSKSKGNHISFGAYMKGNGKNGLFENNLIICEQALPADQGVRIGLSFGGGGTSTQYCRNQNCDTEHVNGVMRNNIILNCSHDVGIYLNRSKNTEIYNNLIFNSLGIDVRYDSSSAKIYNNIISGRIKIRNGAKYTAQNNLIDQDCIAPDRLFSSCSFIDWYWDIINADLEIKIKKEKMIGSGIQSPLAKDFCENPLQGVAPDIGPIQYSNNLTCSPDKMNKNRRQFIKKTLPLHLK